MYTQAARWVCVVLIFDESVIASLLLRLFLVVAGLREFDDEARQSLDDESFLLVVELFPQARLRNRNVEEVQIQLRHGSPDLDQMLQSRRQRSRRVSTRVRRRSKSSN